MTRRRQVRLSYPPMLVELAVGLARRHGRRRAAQALGLPLSTIYRWLAEHRSSPAADGPDSVESLVAACELHGFDLRQRVRVLEPLAIVAPVPREPIASTRRERPPEPAADTAARARVQRARHEIDQRYYAPLSCEQLAALVGMSRFHFIRTFRAAWAVTPYRYLMQVRVRHARVLLGSTAQPLETIAAAVGFDSPSSLSKAFRNVEGMTLSACFRGVRLGAALPRRRDSGFGVAA